MKPDYLPLPKHKTIILSYIEALLNASILILKFRDQILFWRTLQASQLKKVLKTKPLIRDEDVRCRNQLGTWWLLFR